MKDQYGVIKFQLPYALTIWAAHVVLMVANDQMVLALAQAVGRGDSLRLLNVTETPSCRSGECSSLDISRNFVPLVFQRL